MSLSEFDIIYQYFKKNQSVKKSVITGIGDDAAIIDFPPGHQVAVSTDTLVCGVHFPKQTNPDDIGYKALAVNISDMAAMGAEPLYVTLSITLETNNSDWLESFSQGFFRMADRYSISLVGGDVTRGPLSITVQIMGLVPDGFALLRSGAKPGDQVYVTGELGMAAYALYSLNQGQKEVDDECLKRLNRPVPRIETGMALRNIATACIDISDGLHADLSHLLAASSVGAEIYLHQLPLHDRVHDLNQSLAYQLGINTGDDYELCFTVPEGLKEEILEIEKSTSTKLTKIGEITDTGNLVWKDKDGQLVDLPDSGYRHF